MFLVSVLVFTIAATVFGAVFYFYWSDLVILWDNAVSTGPAPAVRGPAPSAYGSAPSPAAQETPVSSVNIPCGDGGYCPIGTMCVLGSCVAIDGSITNEGQLFPVTSVAKKIVENNLPGNSNPEVYNISSNKYTYYDAEPLCKALGAELATYDQVKDAWEKGADWCNYGWTKGQMAVYPTSEETYATLQKGTPEQRLTCGQPGVNGGYFDNPELRYGVNCYGKKPAQKPHDVEVAPQATPTSPEALEFDKKVAAFKSDADTIGILPFNKNNWN